MFRQSSSVQVPGTGVTVRHTFGTNGAQIFVAPAGGGALVTVACARRTVGVVAPTSNDVKKITALIAAAPCWFLVFHPQRELYIISIKARAASA
jgi:hypothetical protein